MTYKEYIVREYVNGDKHYYFNGKLHREGGPAIERADGHKEYYLDGKLHRKDGPAIVCVDGAKYYYLNGRLHRENGPAFVHADGTKYYYLSNKRFTKEEFDSRKDNCVGNVIEIDGKKYTLQLV